MNKFAGIKFIFFVSLLMITANISAQGFLHTDGKRILDGDGKNFIIRSVGTGNWLLMEGYMMQTEDEEDSHTGFRNRLIESIGVANTDSFYRKWNHDHMQKIDVDSLAAWGFNTIRVAMHYKWLTLPIEDEPVPGEHTWHEEGFVILDSLLSWCGSNSMYLILDMHSTPGGQNSSGAISDYDKDKLSLWDSKANQAKLVALWYKLAERYSDEPWLGGYDLINETMWTLPNNNQKLRDIFGRLTDTIRLVDQNHILFIEGNSYANDYTGLTPPWDDNMVYSFHKYGTFNFEHSLDWIINPIRDTHNVPIWLGEAGENSNTWYTNVIRLCESNNVGWSWWPLKKVNRNNPLRVEMNSGYSKLMDSWYRSGESLTAEETFQAVLDFADQHRFENCVIQYDVIDAMIRQPHTTDLKSKIYLPEDTVYAVDYAMGRNGYAYFDTDTAAYYNDGLAWAQWNTGGEYRNDGVDIQVSDDAVAKVPYSVGWTEQGEFLVFLIHIDEPMKFDCLFRNASGTGGGYVVLEANGVVVSKEYDLPGTGGWWTWETDTIKDVVLPAGDIELKVRFTRDGSNFNFFRLTNPRPADDETFEALFSETSILDNDIYIHLNKDITAEEMTIEDFTLFVSNNEVGIDSVYLSDDSDRVIVLKSAESIIYSRSIKVSYQGSSVHSADEDLANFESMSVRNNFMAHKAVPGKIEAEDFLVNNGFALENCKDAGEGKNTGYSDAGDYLDYLIYVREAKEYQINFRVASAYSNARITLQYESDDEFISLGSKSFSSTGGWQSWQTQSTIVEMPQGKYIFRIKVNGGEYNMNWFQFLKPSGTNIALAGKKVMVYPNPANEQINIETGGSEGTMRSLELYNTNGALVWKKNSNETRLVIDIADFGPGTYFLKLIESGEIRHQKILIY